MRVAFCSAAQRKIDWVQMRRLVLKFLLEVENKLKMEGDPVGGYWPVSATAPVTVWTDASTLAIRVAKIIDGEIAEDAAWLKPKTILHIEIEAS